MFNLVVAALLIAAQDAPDATSEPAAEPEIQEEAESPEEEVICRRRIVPSERVGERFRRQNVCKTRAEWEQERLGRR